MHTISQKSPKSKQSIYAGGHVIGYVRGETFYKDVDASRHFLRQPAAIAFDVATLDDAELFGAKFAQVKDRESGRNYKAALSLVRSAGVPVNRGFGKQIALPLCYWNVNGKAPEVIPMQARTVPADLQPRLL